MNTFQNLFLNDPDDDLKKRQANNDVTPDDDGIGENTEQTPLAIAVTYEAEKKQSEKEKAWDNNKPGTTNENDFQIPTVTPDNDNGEAGPKRK